MDNGPGTPLLLAGQTSIDDVLKEQYDLTPQLPLHWAVFESTHSGRHRDADSETFPSTGSERTPAIRSTA